MRVLFKQVKWHRFWSHNNTFFLTVYTLHEHLEHLQCVLECLWEVNLKLNPLKWRLAREAVNYLGLVIMSGGLRSNPQLTDAVQKFPQPCENMQDVQIFLGKTSFYRSFISNLANVTHTLHQLKAKGVPFVLIWPAECEAAFLSIKSSFMTLPVIAYPCFGIRFMLKADTFTQGLGAVLSQVQENEKLHPVAYASQVMNPLRRTTVWLKLRH